MGVGRLNSNCQSVGEHMRPGKPDPSGGDQGVVADVVQTQAPPTLVPSVDALDHPAFWQDDEAGKPSLGRPRLLGIVEDPGIAMTEWRTTSSSTWVPCAACRVWAHRPVYAPVDVQPLARRRPRRSPRRDPGRWRG